MFVIKNKDSVYFAYSLKEMKRDYPFIDTSLEENSFIWHLNDGYGTIVGVVCASQRFADVLRYSDVFNCDFSIDGMYQIIDNIKQLIKDTNIIIDKNKSIYIARANECYCIFNLSTVEVFDDFEFFKENDLVSEGIYYHYMNIPNVLERIKKTYIARDEILHAMSFPVAVISTLDDSFTLIE